MDTGSGNKKVDFLAFFGKFGDFGIYFGKTNGLMVFTLQDKKIKCP